jgi:hypothetical protein
MVFTRQSNKGGKVSIEIACECGFDIDVDEDFYLDSEDYTPMTVTCPDCGKKFKLCVHIEEEGK